MRNFLGVCVFNFSAVLLAGITRGNCTLISFSRPDNET